MIKKVLNEESVCTQAVLPQAPYLQLKDKSHISVRKLGLLKPADLNSTNYKQRVCVTDQNQPPEKRIISILDMIQ
jgi:hypothetical protein